MRISSDCFVSNEIIIKQIIKQIKNNLKTTRLYCVIKARNYTKQPFLPMSVTPSERLTGRVKWFNNKTGYGFITIADGVTAGNDVFVHHSSINVDNQQYKYLVQGEYVECCVVPIADDTDGGSGGGGDRSHSVQASNVCGIKGGKLMCETRNESQVARFQYHGEQTPDKRPVRDDRRPDRRPVRDDQRHDRRPVRDDRIPDRRPDQRPDQRPVRDDRRPVRDDRRPDRRPVKSPRAVSETTDGKGPGVESGHWKYVTSTTVELTPTKKERSRATPGPN